MSPWIVYAILAAVAAALVGVFSKVGIEGVDPTIATTIRGLVIALFMGVAALYFGKFDTLSSIPPKSLAFIVLTGVAGGLSWLWGFYALKLGGDATAVNAIDHMSLVILVIFAILFLGESLTWLKAIGALLVTTGVIFMTASSEQILKIAQYIKNPF